MTRPTLVLIEGGLSLQEKQLKSIEEFKQNIAFSAVHNQGAEVRRLLSDLTNLPFLAEFVESNQGPCSAARNGGMQSLQAFLEHESFLTHCPHHLIQPYMDEMFMYASMGEHLDIMDFLVTSTKLPANATVDAINKRAFFMACRGQRYKVLDYLLVTKQMQLSLEDTQELQEDTAIDQETLAFVMQKINKIVQFKKFHVVK